MSGLAAGIRLAYYDQKVCVLERHTTIGDAWRNTQQAHWRHFIDWLHTLFVDYDVSPARLYGQLLT